VAGDGGIASLSRPAAAPAATGTSSIPHLPELEDPMIRRSHRLGLPSALLLPLLAAHSGGWATITVENLPDYVVARQPTELAFTVRQHGMQPLNDLTPVIEATAGKQRTTAQARRGKAAGEYVVALNLPEPGEWTVTIHSKFGPSSVTLLPLRATGAGALSPPTFTPAERGHRLFVAKGCLTCHVHRQVARSGIVKAGPELTEARFTDDYLARFLENPSIKAPTGPNRMPNLQLEPNEIAALVAFLNAEPQKPPSR
jgi:cytochrome c2